MNVAYRDGDGIVHVLESDAPIRVKGGSATEHLFTMNTNQETWTQVVLAKDLVEAERIVQELACNQARDMRTLIVWRLGNSSHMRSTPDYTNYDPSREWEKYA